MFAQWIITLLVILLLGVRNASGHIQMYNITRGCGSGAIFAEAVKREKNLNSVALWKKNVL